MTTRKATSKAKAAPKRGRGRPAYVPTPESRQIVTQLLSVGTTLDDVALVLRISDVTLVKHYAHEIRFGRVERRAEVVGLLYTQARNGNVSATKHLEAMTSVASAETTFKDAAEAPAKPARRLGKKEQALLDAETAGQGSDWGSDLGTVPPAAGKTAH